jgi:hypothetical protein
MGPIAQIGQPLYPKNCMPTNMNTGDNQPASQNIVRHVIDGTDETLIT